MSGMIIALPVTVPVTNITTSIGAHGTVAKLLLARRWQL